MCGEFFILFLLAFASCQFNLNAQPVANLNAIEFYSPLQTQSAQRDMFNIKISSYYSTSGYLY